MSLIYDALRSQDAQPRSSAAPSAPAWWTGQSPRRRGVLLAAGALLAAPLAFVAAMGTGGTGPMPVADTTPILAASPAPAPAATSTLMALLDDTADEAAITDTSFARDADALRPVDTADVATAVSAPESVARMPTVAASTIEVDVPVQAADAPAQQAVAAVVAAVERAAPAASAPHATAAMPAPAESASIRVERRSDAGASVGQHDDAAVVGAMQAVEAAVAANDLPAAREALTRLEAVLPTSSLTLLRMRAWVAHGSHDMAGAESLYRQIIERVPDDMNAGVNIALLDARRGDVGDARDRLTRLAARHLRSPQVARALAELDTLAQ